MLALFCMPADLRGWHCPTFLTFSSGMFNLTLFCPPADLRGGWRCRGRYSESQPRRWTGARTTTRWPGTLPSSGTRWPTSPWSCPPSTASTRPRGSDWKPGRYLAPSRVTSVAEYRVALGFQFQNLTSYCCFLTCHGASENFDCCPKIRKKFS